MTQTIISFDLNNPKSGDYTTAAGVLRALGFYQFTPGGKLKLPSTTFVGNTLLSTAELRDTVRARFAAAGLTLGSVFVAEFYDWSAWGIPVNQAA